MDLLKTISKCFVIIAIAFVMVKCEPISDSCRPRSKDWILSDCVEVYDLQETCLTPISCKISEYRCPGFCQKDTAITVFPCHIKYM